MGGPEGVFERDAQSETGAALIGSVVAALIRAVIVAFFMVFFAGVFFAAFLAAFFVIMAGVSEEGTWRLLWIEGFEKKALRECGGP